MNGSRWLKRLLYLLIIVVWLLLMIFPTFAFMLANNGRIELGSNPRNQLRFFLVQEEDADGIGMEWSRPSWGQAQCAQTSLAYLFWEGGESGQNATYCHCYDPVTEAPLPVEAGSCR